MSWPELFFKAANGLWFLLGAASLACSALVILNPVKRRFPYERRYAAAILGFAIPLFVVGIKMAQHHNFQLTSDSAHVVNYGWNAIHGYGLYSSPYGMPFLSIHFQLATPIISPLLLLWDHINVFIILHGLALGSTVYGVYLLTKRRSNSHVLAWLMALLALSHPCFRNLMSTIIEDSVFATPLFIWMAYFFEANHPLLALLFLLLLLTTKEEATALLCGAGAYLLLRKERKPILGSILIVSGIGLVLLEVSLIMAMKKGAPCAPGFFFFAPQLGTSLKEIGWNVLQKPWIFLLALVYPVGNLWAGIYNLFFAGLFPLLSGAAFLPFYIAWLPHQLAKHSNFHWLRGYYGGFVFGPMLWSMLIGASCAWKRVDARKRRILTAYVLCVAAVGFFISGGYYNSRLMPSSWRTAVPKMAALIPADSKLWCDSYLSPHFALRRHIKALPRALPDCQFESDFFLPDQVLLTSYWTYLSEAATVERIFGFLRRHKFEAVFREKDLVLFERKDRSGTVEVQRLLGGAGHRKHPRRPGPRLAGRVLPDLGRL